MPVTGLSLRQQLSSGLDGVRYLAADAKGHALVVDRLQSLRQQSVRWEWVRRRIQLLASLDAPGLVPLLQHDLQAPVPYLVSPYFSRSLSAVLAGEAKLGSPLREGIRRLAGALAAAHRVGIVADRMRPAQVWLDDDALLRVELFGVHVVQPASSAFDEACTPPEAHTHSYAADVYALAGLWRRALDMPAFSGQASAGDRQLIERMQAPDPAARPHMADVYGELVASGQSSAAVTVRPDHVPPEQVAALQRNHSAVLAALGPGQSIGRFRLDKLLGEGGMGRVFGATDSADGSAVAVKLLHPRWAENQLALQRFYREARLLSQLDNPFIARFVEVNRDRGIHYLAMELVTGQALDELLDGGKAFNEQQVLSVLADMARALADIHDLGVVHRDIKPANVLVRERGRELSSKLCDFGIARHMGAPEEATDRVTRLGTAVGTPQYMAPEQCVGAAVDARSDIYALGITAYELLSRQLPFSAPTIHEVVLMHLNEPPTPLRELCPEVSVPMERLVTRMLAKKPEDRFDNARALLEAVERLRRGASQQIQRRPAMPATSADDVLSYDVELSLRGTPAELWPHVSNTERLNRAAGISSVEFAWQEQPEGRELRGSMSRSGLSLNWRENPFEWVAPQRMGVLREYDGGPFLWLRSTVQLSAQGQGTLLRHRVEVAPRGVFGRAAAAMEVGFRLRRGLERVYRSIDAYVQACKQYGGRAALSGAGLDPFETPPELLPAQRVRLDEGLSALKRRGVDPLVAKALCEYLGLAPAQAVARIRPRAFASRYGLESREVLHACFYAVKDGLLNMLWNVLCPRCQVPASIEESLRNLRDHAHCEACALDYGVDFGRSIEVVFAAHPSIRATEQSTYCIGGPAHRPHVVAQVRLEAGARFAFDLALSEGNYQVAARELPSAWAFSVSADAPLSEWEVSLRRGLPAALPRTLKPGHQRVVLSNDYDHEIVARIERTNARVNAVTATEAACSSLFRELFPDEVLAPGLLISTNDVALVQVSLHQPWKQGEEADVFAALTELVHVCGEEAQREGGAVVKIQGDGVLVSFPDIVAAVRAALRLTAMSSQYRCRAAVHGGSAMVTSINERLDYFGRVVRDTEALLDSSRPGELVLSEAVQVTPEVSALLSAQAQPMRTRVLDAGSVVGLAVSPRSPAEERA